MSNENGSGSESKTFTESLVDEAVSGLKNGAAWGIAFSAIGFLFTTIVAQSSSKKSSQDSEKKAS